MTLATFFRPPPAVDSQGLTPRATTYALLTPVILSLTLMAFLPQRYGSPGVIIMSGARLASTAGTELLLAFTVGGWLVHQGWRPQRTATLAFVPRDVLRALGLWCMALIALWCSALVWRTVAPNVLADALGVQIVGRPSAGIVVLLSAINAVVEEFLWLGLGVAALRRYGLGFACIVSVALRTMLHIYQGPLALIAILPLGVVYTAYYVRTRRIWPVVLAHCLQDLLSLGLIVAGATRPGAV